MSRLFWKIFLVYAGLILAMAVGLILFVSRSTTQIVTDSYRHRLYDTAIVLRRFVSEAESAADLQKLIDEISPQTGTRITLIDEDGLVLADSYEDPKNMENHRDRPELMLAKETGQGADMRTSRTVGYPMMYLALPLNRDDELDLFVRVSVDMRSVNESVAHQRWLLGIMVASISTIALLLTFALVRRLFQPLEELTRAAEVVAMGDEDHVVAVPGDDEAGKLARAFNNMRMELVSRLQEVREGSERMSAVLGGMVEGVIAVGKDNRILLANEASRELLGFSAEEVIGSPLFELTRSLPLRDAVQQAIRERIPHQCEFESPAVSRRVLSVRATPFPSDPGPGVVVVLHDVTELRRLETMRRDFVANVSHELKTPLASVKAYAETLRLGAMDDEANRMMFVERIEEQADRLHALIVDLLQLARVESGKQTFDIVNVAVSAAVANCVRSQRPSAESRHIALEVEPSDESVRVVADEEGVRTILDNLVTNAIKYTPEGGRVTVGWTAEAASVVISVSDTGIGIPAEHLERVFERFYRVDKARSRDMGGTGLGLSIVKHLVQSFGGSVAVFSRVHEGSRFEIRLPRAPL